MLSRYGTFKKKKKKKQLWKFKKTFKVGLILNFN